MYIVMQRRPHTKIIFASNSYDAAVNFFDLQINHGFGWFELLRKNNDTPLRSGGVKHTSAHHRQKGDNLPRMPEPMQYDTIEHNLLARLFTNHGSPDKARISQGYTQGSFEGNK